MHNLSVKFQDVWRGVSPKCLLFLSSNMYHRHMNGKCILIHCTALIWLCDFVYQSDWLYDPSSYINSAWVCSNCVQFVTWLSPCPSLCKSPFSYVCILLQNPSAGSNQLSPWAPSDPWLCSQACCKQFPSILIFWLPSTWPLKVLTFLQFYKIIFMTLATFLVFSYTERDSIQYNFYTSGLARNKYLHSLACYNFRALYISICYWYMLWLHIKVNFHSSMKPCFIFFILLSFKSLIVFVFVLLSSSMQTTLGFTTH